MNVWAYYRQHIDSLLCLCSPMHGASACVCTIVLWLCLVCDLLFALCVLCICFVCVVCQCTFWPLCAIYALVYMVVTGDWCKLQYYGVRCALCCIKLLCVVLCMFYVLYLKFSLCSRSTLWCYCPVCCLAMLRCIIFCLLNIIACATRCHTVLFTLHVLHGAAPSLFLCSFACAILCYALSLCMCIAVCVPLCWVLCVCVC
jgi:hypothetical protein